MRFMFFLMMLIASILKVVAMLYFHSVPTWFFVLFAIHEILYMIVDTGFIVATLMDDFDKGDRNL